MVLRPKLPFKPAHSWERLPEDYRYYRVSLERYGVPIAMVEWCKQNCKNDFGWFFESFNNSIMMFEDKEDAILFKLACI